MVDDYDSDVDSTEFQRCCETCEEYDEDWWWITTQDGHFYCHSCGIDAICQNKLPLDDIYSLDTEATDDDDKGNKIKNAIFEIITYYLLSDKKMPEKLEMLRLHYLYTLNKGDYPYYIHKHLDGWVTWRSCDDIAKDFTPERSTALLNIYR